MDSLSSAIYGIIQGLTEFLPVSSSGHLALLPHFLEIKDPGVLFDLSMHVGTAFSIILYFHRDILSLLNQLIELVKTRNLKRKESQYVLNMLFSTVISFIFVLLLKGFSEAYARTPLYIALNLFVFGILMWAADYFTKNVSTKKMERSAPKEAAWIGLFQALAIFPGVSRSGATLTISRFLGLGREEATRYSFLLSLPIILAGFFYKLPKMFNGENSFDFGLCLFGMLVSFATGLITIHFFLRMIKKVGLGVFSVYRAILAGAIYWYLI